MHKSIWLALSVALLCLAGPAFGQKFPYKPLRLIVPYPPGGGTDRLARPIAAKLSDELHQQIVVVNRGGADGIIAMNAAAQAMPDGYTMVIGLTAQLAINPSFYKHLAYDPVRDFTPITLLGSSPYLLTAYPAVPVRSVKDLIALAKKEPGRIAFSSSGTGGIPHLAGEMLMHMAGIQLLHVPYKGGGPALRALVGGHVQLNFAVIAASYGLVKAGKLRALAVTSAQRSPVMPQVPTVAETVPGYDISTWFGILAPAHTPKAIVALLNKRLQQVLHAPSMKKRLPLGFVVEAKGPQDFKTYLAAQIKKWANILEESGIKPH